MDGQQLHFASVCAYCPSLMSSCPHPALPLSHVHDPLRCCCKLCRILLPRCQGSHPFYTWTHIAWMIDGLMLYYQQGALLRYISGSQLAVWYYRALGARIGKGVLLNGLHR